ncbi:histidine phosphatase family protein [Aeromicrobium wangtongii]|uniref:Histidine phosphatase family protein n=1 Tax=Aeromicrobium wangtongii TaxID=2969247 RepID=A0ABY5MAV2_9ACTN|nr:histidine phosphatase family protein [Aeromicrobium wangtongii]MCD9199735.1 histidine phosphatase family protein [Aeromicrobium wangtongii]UUP14084.1 histidine phosphatase family protein [Aeromicrobium wangtongii]
MDHNLWIGAVRHGESTANIAARDAARDGLDLIEITEREADVPLSDLGRRQAESLGRRLARMPGSERPELVLASPFLRARETAEIATSGLEVPMRIDERLRDRDLGILDLHTVEGIRAEFPQEAERRRHHGKFYYRPPGGESWTDVALRLRMVLREIEQDLPAQRVLVVAHDVVVALVRYVLEDLDEHVLMEEAKKMPVSNASLSSWIKDDHGWHRERFNDVTHLEGDDSTRPTAEEPVA